MGRPAISLVSLLFASLLLTSVLLQGAEKDESAITVGSRRELFVDDFLIDKFLGQAERRLHHPLAQEIAIKFDAPWEGSGSNYVTIFRDGELYRMYYRGAQYNFENDKLIQPHPQVTCYAESRDGITWKKPDLGLFEWDGSKKNNIVWAEGRATHNFTPFKDSRPGVPANERYKALAYAPQDGSGLAVYASSDGLRWHQLTKEAVLTIGAFDSQNLAFWDEQRGEYRAYFRHFREGFREIRTATSKDMRTWTHQEWLDYPGAPREHLYTNQIKPYFRAPHLFIGLPTRYADRGWSKTMKELPEAEHREMRAKVQPRLGTALTDTLLMSSRDGRTFQRWDEAFLPPGPERPGTWNYGHLYTAWGLLETPPRIEGMPDELSIYATERAWTGTGCSLRRYTLRMDGFASVHAGISGGELRTKPLIFKGKELSLNVATSAAGHVRVAIHDVNNQLIEGFGINDCTPIFGDTLDRTVTWKGNPDLSKLAGQPVRLRFVLKDANLYSFQFRGKE